MDGRLRSNVLLLRHHSEQPVRNPDKEAKGILIEELMSFG